LGAKGRAFLNTRALIGLRQPRPLEAASTAHGFICPSTFHLDAASSLIQIPPSCVRAARSRSCQLTALGAVHVSPKILQLASFCFVESCASCHTRQSLPPVRFQKRQVAPADDSTSRATLPLPLGLGADCLRLPRGLARAESLEQITTPTAVLSQEEETLCHRPSDLKTLRDQCDLPSPSLLTPCPRLCRVDLMGHDDIHARFLPPICSKILHMCGGVRRGIMVHVRYRTRL